MFRQLRIWTLKRRAKRLYAQLKDFVEFQESTPYNLMRQEEIREEIGDTVDELRAIDPKFPEDE